MATRKDHFDKTRESRCFPKLPSLRGVIGRQVRLGVATHLNVRVLKRSTIARRDTNRSSQSKVFPSLVTFKTNSLLIGANTPFNRIS